MIKLVTERAHLMCPNMFFGIEIVIEKVFDEGTFTSALYSLTQMHPTILMNTVFDDDNNVYLNKSSDDSLSFTVSPSYDRAEVFDEISKSGWDTRSEKLLKVVVSPLNGSFRVLFVAHHLLGDGRAILMLAQDFTSLYCYPETNVGAIIPKMISSIDDLPSGSTLPFMSRVITNDANKKFSKEAKTISYDEYLVLEKKFAEQNSVSYKFSSEDVSETVIKCKEAQISVNDYLLARMMKTENKNTILIASDIRSKTSCYVPGSLGNFATAFSVTVKNNDCDDIELARRIHKEVLKITSTPAKEMLVLSFYLTLNPSLLDVIAASSLTDYPSKAGKFVGDNMFGYKARSNISITNLGKFENPLMSEAYFIPPASPANKKTRGVLTLNGKMYTADADYRN